MNLGEKMKFPPFQLTLMRQRALSEGSAAARSRSILAMSACWRDVLRMLACDLVRYVRMGYYGGEGPAGHLYSPQPGHNRFGRRDGATGSTGFPGVDCESIWLTGHFQFHSKRAVH